MPLDGASTIFSEHYTPEERLFSEAVMTYWTNFAHTGNPNAPHRNTYMTLTRREWMQYEVDWPEYERRNQSYMLLGMIYLKLHQISLVCFNNSVYVLLRTSTNCVA